MTIGELYPRVSAAIERAERLEDEGDAGDAKAAQLDVSMLEEEIAAVLPVSDEEGVIARRGAVRAALNAGVYARAKDLAERYGAEPGAPDALREDLRGLAADAELRLDLAAIPMVRVVPAAKIRFHVAA